jgi:putative ABC transport system ATP-binding protein
MTLIDIRQVTKHYGSGSETFAALRGVSFTIAAGEFVAIMGQSGSGKSTLLSILGGMSQPSTGELWVGGEDIYRLSDERRADFRASQLGFVFQSFHLIPYLTAQENVLLPLAIGKQQRSAKYQAAAEALGRVGLAGKKERLPNQLSGGEQERVAIARAIVNRPQILLADEPTGNLDSHNSEEVMALFAELNRAGQTIVMVTHNPDNCVYAERTIHLRDGLVVQDSDIARAA